MTEPASSPPLRSGSLRASLAPVLSVHDLTVRFRTDAGEVPAVGGVSFDLAERETLGVVGESGSGKTAMAKALLGLWRGKSSAEVSGSVRLEGEELLGLAPRRLREVRGKKIAMVFQEPMSALNPVLTVGFQIMETIAAHEKVSRKERRDRAIEMLYKVGIPSPEIRIDDYPHQLSGGMRQRVMIAMALILGPRVLVADEPTTALDVTVQAQILDLVARLKEEMGTAVILVTHDLGVVAEASDRVLVMYAGRIVECAKTLDLFRAPRHPYARGLLDSLPGLREGPLAAIPGTVPDPHAFPPGCRFHPRCGRAEARCGVEEPKLEAAGEDRLVACHFPIEDPGR